MKKFIFSSDIMGSLRMGFLFVVLAIFTISPFHFDVADGIRTDSLLAMDLFIKENTLAKDPATGKEVPFSELKSGNPKLSSSLNQLVSARKHSAEFRVNAFAKERGMKLKDDLIRVVIEINADSHEPLAEEILDDVRDRIIHAGGKFELDFHNLLQVLLPVEALEEAASWPEVKFIREPFRAHPIKDGSEVQDQSKGDLPKSQLTEPNLIRTSEGVNLILSDEWKAAGYTGAGTKIAVIDEGFKDYGSLLGKELPDSVTTQFYGSGEDICGTEHGTAGAEIIYDMAPDAQLFFTQPRTEVELWDAINWCVSQGVQVISHSMAYAIAYGPLNGTGPVNDIVNQAVNHGITWVNSAGNEAQAHWSGHFYDPDGDGFINFSGTDETDDFYTYEGEEVIIGMIWDDPWGASCNDYDLYVFRLDDFDLSSPVAYSTGIQDGDDDPSEFITFTSQPGTSYGFAINKKNGISKNIHVTLLTGNFLEYQVPETSICIPADNPNVIAIGAVAWNSPSTIEYFSSWGPTTDGRIKPDLVAPDRVTTYSYYPQFFGTSASCPHVAGACALVKQACPAWSSSQIKDFLESEATDLGTPGKDNTYGSGLVYLSELPGNVPENGYLVTSDLWIRAVINTVEKGPIEALWQKGGEGTTSRGDRVIWGHFYASPTDVTWGSQNNPDLFVKIWFDVSGRVDVNYFHVSVPDIEVYSDYPYDGTPDEQGTTTMSRRYIRQYYQNGQSYSEENYEDGNPPSGYTATGNPSGYSTINDLTIGSIINTVEKGPIDAVWRFGGQDNTSRGDQVVWGHFYADPSDVTWGSQDNPDLFVKIWFDVSGRVDVNFFHVSVPDIEVYSDLPDDDTYDQKGTTTMDNRYIRHEYWR